MAELIKKSQLGVPLGNKLVLGELTSFSDGTAKWTYAKDINPVISGFGDRSTFTLNKKSDGTWSWSPTTDTSLSNLATRENLTTQQITSSLYADKAPASSVLNGGNITNLGGIAAAKKLGVPGTNGVSTATGALPSQISGNFTGQPNATPDPENPGATQQTGAKPEEFNQDNLNQQISDRSGGIRQNYGDMRYPKNAKFMSEQDCIKFTMYRYQAKKVAITSGLGAFSGSNKGSLMGTVMLSIQPTISDSNVVNWGENPMNALQAAAGAAALAGIQKGPEGLGQSLEDIAKGVRANNKEIGAGLAAYFASEAAGGNQGFLTRATGAVLNNNLELLFQGPSLRSFNFTFSMSARFKEEAEEIRKIIRFFKQGMSVKRAEGNLFLKTPNIFDIQYYFKDKEHPYINKIKTCALQNCSVNYTPAGNYATYDDGAMTQYDITLTFGEIEPLFDDDYGQTDDGLIGY